MCGLGTYSDDEASVCSACPPGSITSATVESNCEGCPMGNVQPLAQMNKCDACDVAKYSDVVGGTECKWCPPGTFGTSNGTSGCNPCNPGSYQPLEGKKECQLCGKGKIAPKFNAINCSKCPAGFMQPQDLGVGCIPCTAGRSTNGQAGWTGMQCEACPEGKYCDHRQPLACSTEARDTWMPGECDGTEVPPCKDCTDCGWTYYNEGKGNRACKPCGDFEVFFGLMQPFQCLYIWVLPGAIAAILCLSCIVKAMDKLPDTKQNDYEPINTEPNISDDARVDDKKTNDHNGGDDAPPPYTKVDDDKTFQLAFVF
jgi:hypothetical protein